MKLRSALIVASLILAAACGGTDDAAPPASTTSPPSTDVVDTPTSITETPSSDTSTTDPPSSGEITPPGWVESISRYDDTAGEFVESSDDPRFTSFVWIAEGCCDAGLDASFGSPELPDSDDAADLGDGLYIAKISGWEPAEPDWVLMDVRRVVDCGSDQAAGLYYCEIYDYQPGRFEALESSETFRLRLDDNLSIQLSAPLEPVDGDEFYTNYSWIGQGPDFSRLLVDLHASYTKLITEPFRSGASFADIDGNLTGDSNFRRVELDSVMPYGLWRTPNGPAVTFNVMDGLVPDCYSEENCIDGGDSQTTPASFESLFGKAAGLQVTGGRMAFLLLGAQLGG